MKSLPVLAMATILALITVLVLPLVTRAHPGDFPVPADGASTADFSPRTAGFRLPATDGDHALYVRASGTYPDDGVILPVSEALEARYMAAGREFTVEYWFKLRSGYDSNGKELFDHHVPSNEGFWTGFQDGHLWAGIDTEPDNDDTAIHIHTGSGFNDGEWHHYALVRDLSASPDRLCLYLDGTGSCYASGSKPEWAPVSDDIRPSLNRDGDDTNNKPLYVIGARTNGGSEIEAVIDELRISDAARYRDDFTPPAAPFSRDASTVMLFHFDEGAGNTTSGRDSNDNPIEGTLVREFANYGLNITPLDPDDPADAAWLGEMWADGRFGATAPASLRLTSPKGGELWLTDSQYQIRWTSDGPISEVSLSYSTDGFTSVSHIIVASTPNDGIYTWTTPATPSKTTRVRVADIGAPAIYDDSADFVLTDTIYLTYMPLILKSWP